MPGRSLNVESFEPGGRARGGARIELFLNQAQYLIYSTNTFTPIEDTEVFTQFSFWGGQKSPQKSSDRLTYGTFALWNEAAAELWAGGPTERWTKPKQCNSCSFPSLLRRQRK